MVAATKYRDLRSASKESLEATYDAISSNTQLGLNFYRDELARREAEEQNQRMLDFTRQMRNMTIGITVMTVIILVLTVINVYVALK